MSSQLVLKLFLVCFTAMLLVSLCGVRALHAPDVSFQIIEQQFIEGQLSRAEESAKQAEQWSGRMDPALAQKLRLQRAKIWFYQGRSAQALALLLPPIPAEISDKMLASTRSSMLAAVYARTGDLVRAQQELTEAEAQCTDDRSRSVFHLYQGVVAGENGKFRDAERAFEISLANARNAGDRFLQAQALANLSVAALRQEHYDQALDRFSQTSDLATTIRAGFILEKALGNSGWAFYKLGDYRRALTNSQLAEHKAAALGVAIDQVEWLNNAGLSQFRLGDLGAAKASYEQSYQLARSLQNKGEMGDALLALAYLSLETGDLPDALDKSRQVQRIATEMNNPDDTVEPSLIEAVTLARRGQTSVAKNKLLSLEQTTAPVESVRWQIENALATLFASTGDTHAADTWFRRAIATFRLQRSSISSIDSRLPFFENGSTLYLGYMEELIREGKQGAALAILDQSRAETLAEGLGQAGSPLDGQRLDNPQAVARRLGGTILVYCLRPGTSYLWAISPKKSALLRLPGREAILPLVAAHEQAVVSSKDILARQNAPGLAVYRQLVEPAQALLPSGGKVFIIADEALNGLNFESLPTTETEPHFWIEDADIVNARSISLLASTRTKPPQSAGPTRLLLVGNPVYDRPEDAQLPHAAEEVQSVAQHFSPERRLVLTGAGATPAAYRQSHPESFAYIHFVAHATASELNPLDSSVILSAAPGDASKLYARSLLGQRLSADLVTISACYGSGARSYSGEGLVGLAWAFLHSGSHHVIGALWEVSDASTPQLMSDMYDGLAAGKKPDTALRSAKLAMIHRGGVFRKPFYWAAFQLYSGA